MIDQEARAAGKDWPLIQAGLFNGSFDRFTVVKEEYNERFMRVRRMRPE